MQLYILQLRVKPGVYWSFVSWTQAVWTDLNKLHAFIANYFDVEYIDPVTVRGGCPRVWTVSAPRTDVEFRIVEVESN